jgi:alkaline phosphatase
MNVGYSLNTTADNEYSDPASGATAMAIGYKTRLNHIGVDKDNLAHPNLIELASVNGLSTGIITNSTLITPVTASFLVHHNNYSDASLVAFELLNSPIDLFIAGKPEDAATNLIKILKNKGFGIYTQPVNKIRETKFALLFASDIFTRSKEKWSHQAVEISLKKLQKNPNGFLLVIHATDKNTIDYSLDELIGSAFDFADDNPSTLVIITSLGSQRTAIHNRYNSEENNKALVEPVFSYGKGSKEFKGFYENTDIFNKIVYLMQMSEGVKDEYNR